MTERFADSFVVLAMVNPADRKHRAAVEALSGNRHFEQAGFVALLK
jgi:hypothetical protein